MLQNTPTPSKIAAYQVTDPTIQTNDGPISNLWVSGYQNPWSNLLCGGGATLSYYSGLCSSTNERQPSTTEVGMLSTWWQMAG